LAIELLTLVEERKIYYKQESIFFKLYKLLTELSHLIIGITIADKGI